MEHGPRHLGEARSARGRRDLTRRVRELRLEAADVGPPPRCAGRSAGTSACRWWSRPHKPIGRVLHPARAAAARARSSAHRRTALFSCAEKVARARASFNPLGSLVYGASTNLRAALLSIVKNRLTNCQSMLGLAILVRHTIICTCLQQNRPDPRPSVDW